MRQVKTLALGTFSPANLHTTQSESNRAIDPQIESKIDLLWEDKKKKAEADGRICYNGTSYRLNSFKQEGDDLYIDFGLLEFKARTILPTIEGYFELPEEYYRNGCYCGATVKTSDNRYLMVELSGKSMNDNTIDLLGGIIEQPQKVNTGEDVFESQLIELKEEGCIQKSDIDTCYLRSVYRSPDTNVGFYFEVTLKVTSKEILERFASENKDGDIKALKALNREEYLAVLKNHNPTKQFISSILQV